MSWVENSISITRSVGGCVVGLSDLLGNTGCWLFHQCTIFRSLSPSKTSQPIYLYTKYLIFRADFLNLFLFFTCRKWGFLLGVFTELVSDNVIWFYRSAFVLPNGPELSRHATFQCAVCIPMFFIGTRCLVTVFKFVTTISVVYHM